MDIRWLYNKSNLFKRAVRDILGQLLYTKIKFSRCDSCPFIYHISFKRNPILEIRNTQYIGNNMSIS